MREYLNKKVKITRLTSEGSFLYYQGIVLSLTELLITLRDKNERLCSFEISEIKEIKEID